jgi:hypothetical protein
MAEAQTYTFDYKEIAEALIKKQDLHEGLWGIYMEFGIGGANVGLSEGTVFPTAIVPVVKMGIHRFDKPNNLTVDAAEINPLAMEAPRASGGTQKPRNRRAKV